MLTKESGLDKPVDKKMIKCDYTVSGLKVCV